MNKNIFQCVSYAALPTKFCGSTPSPDPGSEPIYCYVGTDTTSTKFSLQHVSLSFPLILPTSQFLFSLHDLPVMTFS